MTLPKRRNEQKFTLFLDFNNGSVPLILTEICQRRLVLSYHGFIPSWFWLLLILNSQSQVLIEFGKVKPLIRSYLWLVHAMFGKPFSQFLSIFLPSITAVIQRNAFLPLLVKIIYWENLVFVLIFTLELIRRALSTGPGPTAGAACNIGRDISPD